jgi:hypothetical protein
MMKNTAVLSSVANNKDQYVYWFTSNRPAPGLPTEYTRNIGKMVRSSPSGKTITVERLHPVAGGTVKFRTQAVYDLPEAGDFVSGEVYVNRGAGSGSEGYVKTAGIVTKIDPANAAIWVNKKRYSLNNFTINYWTPDYS